MNSFIAGFKYLFAGFDLIAKPRIRRFAIIPVIINIIVFIALFLFLKQFVDQVDLWLQAYLPSWLYWLHYLVWLVFILGFVLFCMFIFVTLANIIGAPFNGLLAEEVELYLTGTTVESLTWFGVIKDCPRMIGRQLALLLYFIPRVLAVGLLLLIPVIHSLVPIIWFAFNAWYISLSFIDYPTDNHRLPLPAVHEFLEQDRMLALGFGISVLCFLAIPLINLFVVPAAVAGATKWWVDKRG